MRWSRIGMPAVIAALAIVFGSINPNFWSATNLANVSRQMSILALLSLGQTFAILSGGIDLSVGSLLALVSVICAQQMKNFGLVEGITAGIVAGGLAGLVNGLIIAKARVPPFIATLGMLVAARGAALTLSGGLPIAGLPREFLVLGAGYVGPFPIPTLIAAVAFLLAHGVLRRTRFGRYVYAMGSNEEAAVLSGINVANYKMLVYITSGLFAGIAGVVIGGGRISGGVGGIGTTLMGVLVLGILGNGLNLVQVSSYIQNIVIGAIIVGAVYVDLARERRR
jgi:ribose/xylose/arabinose/galactoside ABC-type transport system permease subunit